MELMPDITLDAVVTRSDLSLADLDLHTVGFCRVVAWHPAGRHTRNTVQKSGNVNGSILTNTVVDDDVSTLVLRAYGSSQTALTANTLSIIDAFTLQYDYTLTVTVDGLATAYVCLPASVEPANDYDTEPKFGWMTSPKQQTYRLTIPHQPV